MTRSPRRILRLGVAALAIALAVAAVFVDWHWRRPISPSGGRYFFHRIELPVPQFRQADDRWRDDQLGWSNGTLAGEGCAVASVAMLFQYYGIDVDPQQLNWFLTATDGYTDQGWIYWERAAFLAPARVRHVYEDLPSYDLIDANLKTGNPVIVRIRFPNGITHFVVVAGKDGFNYLIRDPGAGASKGIYPLRQIAHRIEALRYYSLVQ